MCTHNIYQYQRNMRLLVTTSLLLSISYGKLVVDVDKVKDLSLDDVRREATLHSKDERPTDCEAVKVIRINFIFERFIPKYVHLGCIKH